MKWIALAGWRQGDAFEPDHLGTRSWPTASLAAPRAPHGIPRVQAVIWDRTFFKTDVIEELSRPLYGLTPPDAKPGGWDDSRW